MASLDDLTTFARQSGNLLPIGVFHRAASTRMEVIGVVIRGPIVLLLSCMTRLSSDRKSSAMPRSSFAKAFVPTCLLVHR